MCKKIKGLRLGRRTLSNGVTEGKKKSWKIRDNQPVQKFQHPTNMSAKKGKRKMN